MSAINPERIIGRDYPERDGFGQAHRLFHAVVQLKFLALFAGMQ
jgi:hypothetical protein